MPPMPQATRWCFTFPNYNAGDVEHLRSLGTQGTTRYLVFGHEVSGETNLAHLQGYVIFTRSVRRSVVQSRISPRVAVHVEVQRAPDNKQAADYCKKDGVFEEFGDLPQAQGKRTDWDRYVTYVSELGRVPTKRELCLQFPGLYARYETACYEIAAANLPHPTIVSEDATPRLGWQTRVDALISSENAHPRKMYFVVDPEGNSGKSWMCRYAMSKYPEKVQVLRVGKRDDLAFSIDVSKSVFLFDIPRQQMTFLQYSILESLKDQLIFSPKYKSASKILTRCPQVIVFSNEEPDLTMLSGDRYEIINI